MGDCQIEPLRPQFDRRLRLEFHGANVTSDAGLLAYRELDDALQLTDTAADELQDTRTGRNTRHGLVALLRQSLGEIRHSPESLHTEPIGADKLARIYLGYRSRRDPRNRPISWTPRAPIAPVVSAPWGRAGEDLKLGCPPCPAKVYGPTS